MDSTMLIKNGTIITMAKDMEFIENGAVYLKNGLIEDYGLASEVEGRNPKADKTLDAGGKFIMPGLVNAHMHLYSTFARGMFLPGEPAKNFVEILEKLWWRLDKKLTLEDCYYSALMPMMDCVRKGVTTIIDHHASPFAVTGSLDENEKAAREIGIRGSFCYELSDRDGLDIRDEGIAENIRFAKKCQLNNDDQIKAMFGLHAAFTLSDESLDKAKQAESDVNCGFHIHTAEDQADVDYNVNNYGLRVVERLEKHGILGEKSLAIHCVHINEKEMDILKNTNTPAVHNPFSNMGNAVGVAPVLEMLAKGVTMGVGTDGYHSDIFESFKQINVLHKLAKRDPRVSWGEPAQMAFFNNTEIAERQFGLPLGVIKKGAGADIILVEYTPPTPMNVNNVFGHMHFGMGACGVHTVIARGNVLMKDRKLVGIDEQKIAAKSRELAANLWSRI